MLIDWILYYLYIMNTNHHADHCPAAKPGDTMHADAGESDCKVCSPVQATDHNFSPSEKAEYDSLNHKGRTYYDDLRWRFGSSHGGAFQVAHTKYGTKS